MSQYGLSSGDIESELARKVRLLSLERWGKRRETVLVGQHESLLEVQNRVLRFSHATGPVLITGETGTGKELFARAIYLLGAGVKKPFFSINCAQYSESQLAASELFGHKRGSFTGAFQDHRGVFSEADGGLVFLDEVGELTLAAQAMLLRVLSEGELVAVGDTRVQHVNVRVIAATNRDLRTLVAQGKFREDLFFRLRYMHLHIPALRTRGADWELLLDYYITRLNTAMGSDRQFSQRAVERLMGYRWPGNVRELRAITETSHALCSGISNLIEPLLFEEQLEESCTAESHPSLGFTSTMAAASPTAASTPALDTRFTLELLERMAEGSGTFWALVQQPFLDRELNRCQVRAVVEEGLRRSNWSYKRALQTFGLRDDDYLKFMDFLRNHRLKPSR